MDGIPNTQKLTIVLDVARIYAMGRTYRGEDRKNRIKRYKAGRQRKQEQRRVKDESANVGRGNDGDYNGNSQKKPRYTDSMWNGDS